MSKSNVIKNIWAKPKHVVKWFYKLSNLSRCHKSIFRCTYQYLNSEIFLGALMLVLVQSVPKNKTKGPILKQLIYSITALIVGSLIVNIANLCWWQLYLYDFDFRTWVHFELKMKEETVLFLAQQSCSSRKLIKLKHVDITNLTLPL